MQQAATVVQRLPKFKPKVYLPLDIAVPPLPPMVLPTLTPTPSVAVAAASAAAAAGGGVAEAAATLPTLPLQPIDFSQFKNSNQSQRYGSVLPPPTPVATMTSNIDAAASASAFVTATSVTATATATVTAAVTTPLLMPVTLQSAAQQLRFFRRYSYNVIVSCIRKRPHATYTRLFSLLFFSRDHKIISTYICFLFVCS